MRIMTMLLTMILISSNPKTYAQSAVYMQPIESQDDSRTAALLKKTLSDPYNNTWNIGSARKLGGRTYILEIWLTARGTSWNIDEMRSLQGRINEATGWLRDKAAEYGRQMVIESGTFAGTGYRGIEMDRLPKSYAEAASLDQLLPTALRKVGYTDIMQCYNQLKNKYKCDNVLVLVMINNDGWSCSNNYSVGHNDYGYQNYFLENTYIFKTSKGSAVSSQTIAHEILHLFGAWDMYEGQASDEAAKWARQYYPNEIMLQISRPLGELTISPLTAWLTGLSSRHQQWYWKFTRLTESYVRE